jgi:hypothetical protein
VQFRTAIVQLSKDTDLGNYAFELTFTTDGSKGGHESLRGRRSDLDAGCRTSCVFCPG